MSTIIKVLIDSDVILDLFLDREPFADQTEQVFEELAAARFQGYLSTAALLNIYYIARKVLGRAVALDCVQRLLETDGLEVLAVDKRQIQSALNSKMTDFEDAVQAETAQFADINMIVTRNQRHFRHSPVLAVSPEEFLGKLN
jgi:predicted nucleic acid-binding protein